jgi:RsiW-degrading membrane proteinase PrsW (M82 family)
MHLLLMAIAPVVIILFYIYFRDKYEKEPLSLLLKALFLGCLTVIPVIYMEGFLMEYIPLFNFSNRASAFYNAFVVAGFSEELFKFLAFYMLIWKSKEYDERFDGIVYAVFVSLGFAMIENIKYVYNYGETVALTRAFLAVPAHALFGVTMGYYFSLSKFSLNKFTKHTYFYYALIFPIILHGSYDFILMANEPLGMLVFIPFLIYLWKTGFKRIKVLSNESKFKSKK